MGRYVFEPEKVDIDGDTATVWCRGTGWPVAADDVLTFIKHMNVWYNLPREISDWGEYERLCREYGVAPLPDTSLRRVTNADYGMYEYHTDPENRTVGIGGKLNQARARWNEEHPLPPPVIPSSRSNTSTEVVRCSCGHTVSRALVMSTSTGTSCPDCYDRMSD